MKKLIRIAACFFLLWLTYSCENNRQPETKTDPALFANYINGYTSGVVSSRANLVITLGKQTEKYNAGSELPETLLTFDPALEGKTLLVDPLTIEFRPDQPLKNGQSYKAQFSAGELFDIPGQPGDFEFGFTVIGQDFSVFPGQLLSSETNGEAAGYYEGKMVSADDMSIGEASGILSASIPAGRVKVEVAANGPREFTYSIGDIPKKEKSYYLTLSWQGESVGIDKKGELEIEIPGKDEFKLLQVNLSQESSNQNIQLLFSNPVDPGQNLDGLIRIKDADQVRMSVKGSVVMLFPQVRMQGQKTIVIEESVRNIFGVPLGKKNEYVLAMEALKPEVIILGNGVIMPASDDLIMSFKAVSLKAVDVMIYKIYTENIMQFFQYNNYNGQNQLRYVGKPVFRKMVRLDENPDADLRQWNAYSVDLTGMVTNDADAMYRVKISFRKPYSLYNCDGDETSDLSAYEDLPLMKAGELSYFEGSDGYYYDYPENYNWRDREDPCTDSYFTPDRFPERNLLASNLGIIAKSADSREFSVAITDLLTTFPVPSAQVEFYNFQQQKIGSEITGQDGMAFVSVSETPYLILARHHGQQSWLRIDEGASLSMSNFDVSGQKISSGIKGMIYGERGVWRPGDTLFLTFVMGDIAGKLPEDHPVVFELYNSRGQLANRQVSKTGIDGFYTFRPVTDPEAPTGNWKVKVSVGGATFDKSLKIETIKPNRLKMDLTFNREILSKNDLGQRGHLAVKWLHGADAANLKAQVDMRLQRLDYVFDGYPGFNFSDPSKRFWPTDRSVFSGRLDGGGQISFPVNANLNFGAPGMLNAVFTTRVFEEGGNFSTDVFSMPLAPYNRFVGLHVPEGGDYKNMLATDTAHRVEVVVVDKNGLPVSAENLEVSIYRVSWRWWWSSGQDNLASWVRGEDADVILQKNISAQNGEGSFSFRIDYPEWGRYFIRVSDPESGHSAGIPVYIDWPSYVSRKDRNNPAGATILSVASDKEKYHPGDQATLTFPASGDSRALISLETGSEILKYWWVSGDAVQNGFTFDVTPQMAPNIFACVTLLQPHAQTINDLPIRMYGVVPLMVEDPETILKPVIAAPDEIRPETEYVIGVSEENGRPMTYTLAVVDEGLLDLTRFKTPDLWQYFYAREALGVKTWDLFDDVLGAYGGRLQKVLAVGGDEALKVDQDKKPNRFKPVVSFLGPYTLQRNQTASHQLIMPNYVGSVKIMVVTGHDGAFGSADETLPVRQPLMVLPTAPRVIGPDEEFDLPVAVFSMTDKIKDVNIQVSTNGPLSITGDESSEIAFEKSGEKMVFFKLKAGQYEGVGQITVRATSGRETASAQLELGVRNPNAYITTTETVVLDPGETTHVGYDFFGMQGTNDGILEVSGMPSFDLDKNLKYLIRYPYGCVEQITSAAFPQLFLDELTELEDRQKAGIHQNISRAIARLGNFQTHEGGMSYWPGQSYVSDWGTTYAWHFLLLAEQKGYLIPSGFKKRWTDWQFGKASGFTVGGDNNFHRHHRELSQAYRLYTLALAGRPNLSAMNRLRESDGLDNNTRWRLAAAYLLAGMPEAANDLTLNLSYSETGRYESPGFTFGSALRDKAMILEVLVMMGKDEDAFDLAKKMADEMRQRDLSTQTAAYALYAMARFSQGTSEKHENHFEYKMAGTTEEIHSKPPVFAIHLIEGENVEESVEVKNLAGNRLYLTKTISGRPLQGNEPGGSKNLEMTVKYVSIDGKLIDAINVKQGTDFEAVVTIKNPGILGNYENLALSQVFPSGWEILNNRVATATTTEENNYDYRDIRDDRVHTFFDLGASKTVTFKVSLNAAYAGKFYMPGISCQAMYDNSIYSRTKGYWVEVAK